MTTSERASTVDASRATTIRGGAGFVIAGVLQLVAVIRVVLPSAPEWVTPGWQLLGWLVGGLVLVGASIVLALGWRGGSSVVGPSRWGRVALVASGSGDLLLVLAVAVAFISGAANAPWLDPALVAGQAVIFVATAGAATIMRRSGSLTGAARWAFLALAAVDAVGVTLGLASGASLVFLMVVVVARPVVVLVAGTALLLHRRTAEQ